MPEAWDLVPDTPRTEEEITTFILFCEDRVDEPYYFRSFQKPGKVKVNVAGDQYSSFRNIVNTFTYCHREGLLEFSDNQLRIAPGVTNHIWSVFDRDRQTENVDEIDPSDNIAFTFSVQSAQKAGLHVAWSNDAFELWILLHFEDVAPGIWRHRSYVYDRLTALFKAFPDQPPDMATITSRENFSYKGYFKNRTNFCLYVLPHLASRLDGAIQRAKALEAAFHHGQPYHECNPCTKVHHLVASIQSFY